MADYSPVDLSAALTLTVGWRSGTKTKLARIPMVAEVADEFRDVLEDVSAALTNREAEAWTPDAEVTPETYLVASRESIGGAPLLASDVAFTNLPEALESASDLPRLNADDLPAADLSFYALTCGDDPNDRTVFLRRSNPRRGLRRGKWFTSLSDSLTRVEEPIFGFDDQVDLVFQDDHVLVLSQTAFAALFRANDELAAQVPHWVETLRNHVPMTRKGAKRLEARTLRDSRLKRRLEAITTRGHLQDVDPSELREAMTQVGLDPDRLVDSKNRLTFEDEDIPEVLQFLNEDLFYGALTQSGFRADKKAAR
ncbi:hypothetical protein ACVW00_000043 [Marmoricola sp. URHA0025 HA25]